MAGVLYKKEREVLEFLAQFLKQHGFSPTLKEICKATGHRSNATAHGIIRSLVEKGYVQKYDGNTRILKIIDSNIVSIMGDKNLPSIEIPVLGYVTGNTPLESYRDPNATIQVSSFMFSGERTVYALEVKGTYLENDGIFENDYILVEKIRDAVEGEITLSIIENKVAVPAIYKKENGVVVLRFIRNGKNPLYPSVFTPKGRIVGMIRKYI